MTWAGDPIDVDEQGDPWPPELALVATLTGLGAQVEPYAGQVVEVGPYYPEHNLFEVRTTASFGGYPPGNALYAYPHEIQPLNVSTLTYVAEVQAAAVTVYSDEVYDLRDALDAQGIAVTADAVASWTGTERMRVYQLLQAARQPVMTLDKQQALQYLQQLAERP